MLELHHVAKRFAGSLVVDDVSCAARRPAAGARLCATRRDARPHLARTQVVRRLPGRRGTHLWRRASGRRG